VIKRVEWPERSRRADWEIVYTNLGGFAQDESININDVCKDFTNSQTTLNRLRSQCMIALTPKAHDANPDALFLAAITLKLLQRGSLPRIPKILERAFSEGFTPMRIDKFLPLFLLKAIPEKRSAFQLYSSNLFDSEFERSFWDNTNSDDDDTCRWLTPQASLDSLAGLPPEPKRRVDFLYYSPFSITSPTVIELDGPHHKTKKMSDAERKRLLARQKIDVVVGTESNKKLKDLVEHVESEKRIGRTYDKQADEEMFAPSALVRFAAAIALLMQNGDIQPDSILNIELDSEYESVLQSGQYIFEFLRSIEQLWDLRALPIEVKINGKTVHRSGLQSKSTQPRQNHIKIQLHQHKAPHEWLEPQDIPTCVIRGAFLPVDLTFLPPLLAKPRLLRDEDPQIDLLLRGVLVDIFGHEDFRPNQLEAIKSALSGQDSLVLLPTGSGKSLIYQMVGLLQPGITIVVDPIISLIDDQVGHLHEIGIERTIGIHSALNLTTEEMDELQSSIAQGQALFVFISPERLQVQKFRETLSALTANTIVNSAVLDEVHCISEWGHDFRPAYLNVAKNLRTFCKHDDFVPILLALTGTASPAVLRDVEREIRFEENLLTKIQPASHDRPNLYYLIEVAEHAKSNPALGTMLKTTLPQLLGVVSKTFLETKGSETNSGIIFVTTVNGIYKNATSVREYIESLAGDLAKPSAVPSKPLIEIHSSTPPKGEDHKTWPQVKRENARKFIENEIPALVATKSFGMGIDKPNIRWTIHFGYPSSLEAFAQESGRAGRDSKDAYCILITNPAKSDEVKKYLDLTITAEDRRKIYDSSRPSQTDLATPWHFHRESFRGRLSEYRRCAVLIKELKANSKAESLSELAGGISDIPDRFSSENRPEGLGSREWEGDEKAVEKTLYRLSAIGIVDDYLKGSKKFTVKLGFCTTESIDSSLLSSMRRIAPGKISTVELRIASAPENFDERVKHHLKIFIETLYDTIEPARIRAIMEMQQLASSGLDGKQVKARLNAYLSSGPLATAMEEVAESQQLDVNKLTTLLDIVGTEDSDLWIGTSARQLETYPDNPILLSARVIGEGWRAEPDMSIIESALNNAFKVLDQYQLGTDQAASLLNWITKTFDQQTKESLSPKYDALVNAWQQNGLPEVPLLKWESEILAQGLGNPAWLKQLSRIRERRMQRTLKSLTNELERLSS
jgi:ATP-dependent DNA helicase RecQ